MATTGLPGPLSGRVVHSIDYTPAVEAFKFSISHAPPLTFYAGFAGPIGIARGQAAYQVDLQFATPALKSQFVLLELMQSQNEPGYEGFTYDWWEGEVGLGTHWMLTGCFFGQYKQDNDPKQGTNERSVQIMGSKLKKLQ